MVCFVFLLLHLLLTIAHTTNTCSDECQYLYTSNTNNILDPQTALQTKPLNGVLTIAGEVSISKSCSTSSSWETDKDYLLLKKGDTTLLYLRYYTTTYGTSVIYFYNSDKSLFERQSIISKEKYFKIQINVSNTSDTDTKVYFNQKPTYYNKFTLAMIKEALQNVHQIEVYHNGCVRYLYISVCPPTTDKKFCDSGPSTLTATLGSSKTMSCSTRTIFTETLNQTIKWSFEDSNGTPVYENILYTKNLISTAAKENIITSTFNLANFTVKDIGSYKCTLIGNQQTVQDTKIFQVTDEPEISSMVITAKHSTEHMSNDLSQPITFNLASDTKLSWNVTRWSAIENVTLDLQLNLTKTTQQPITAQNTSQLTSLHQSKTKHWKYYTFITNGYVGIVSITAVFKVDDQIFKKLTYIPTTNPACKTNTTIFIICIIGCIVGCIGVIILNNIIWRKKIRQIKRNEITRQDKGLNSTGQGEQDDDRIYDEPSSSYMVMHKAIPEEVVYANIEDDDHYAL